VLLDPAYKAGLAGLLPVNLSRIEIQQVIFWKKYI
jgi:hypothetical protein